jgi:hypothetical protein
MTSSSFHNVIHFLPFFLNHLRLPSPELEPILDNSTQTVSLRLTVSQSVSFGVEPHLGLMTRYLLLFDSYGLVLLERPL